MPHDTDLSTNEETSKLSYFYQSSKHVLAVSSNTLCTLWRQSTWQGLARHTCCAFLLFASFQIGYESCDPFEETCSPRQRGIYGMLFALMLDKLLNVGITSLRHRCMVSKRADLTSKCRLIMDEMAETFASITLLCPEASQYPFLEVHNNISLFISFAETPSTKHHASVQTLRTTEETLEHLLNYFRTQLQAMLDTDDRTALFEAMCAFWQQDNQKILDLLYSIDPSENQLHIS